MTRDRRRAAPLIYVALSLIIVWLPLNRGLIKGASHAWSLGDGFRGSGVSGATLERIGVVLTVTL